MNMILNHFKKTEKTSYIKFYQRKHNLGVHGKRNIKIVHSWEHISEC